MTAVDASTLLRANLLEGVSILVAGGAGGVESKSSDGSLAAEVSAACARLGASVWRCGLSAEGSAPAEDSAEADQAAAEEAVDTALWELGHVDLLVVDAAALFTASAVCVSEDESEGARAALGLGLERSWSITRAVANGAFLARERGGRIVYLAPPATDAEHPSKLGLHAEAARAGLENLARTLSIEWARYGITTVTVAPGVDTTAGEVAALTAYLASPAGAYFSGCLLDLRGPAGHS